MNLDLLIRVEFHIETEGFKPLLDRVGMLQLLSISQSGSLCGSLLTFPEFLGPDYIKQNHELHQIKIPFNYVLALKYRFIFSHPLQAFN